MIMFWILATLMILVAMAFLAPALMGKSNRVEHDRQQQNIAIAKEQLRLLEADKAAGKIQESDYEQTRLEIERALHHDVADNQQEIEVKELTNSKPKWVWLLSLLLIPLVAIPLYGRLGTVELVDPTNAGNAQPQAQRSAGQMDLLEAADSLAKKMEQNPEDAQGWFLLGQTYMAVQEYPKAVESYSKSYALKKDNPRLMLRYADALAMTNNSSMQGLPFDLVKKAVKLLPADPTALWMVGMGYAESGDVEKALHYWNLLLPLVASDPASKQEVEKLIVAANQSLGREVAVTSVEASQLETPQAEKPVAAKGVAIQLQVTLSEALKKQVSPEDSVFIFARATKGPRMPLAAVRKQVKDLPIIVTLDDSSAMQPQFRLSLFPQVLVGARISRSGNPIASAGDFYGERSPVTPADRPELKLEINKVVQ